MNSNLINLVTPPASGGGYLLAPLSGHIGSTQQIPSFPKATGIWFYNASITLKHLLKHL